MLYHVCACVFTLSHLVVSHLITGQSEGIQLPAAQSRMISGGSWLRIWTSTIRSPVLGKTSSITIAIPLARTRCCFRVRAYRCPSASRGRALCTHGLSDDQHQDSCTGLLSFQQPTFQKFTKINVCSAALSAFHLKHVIVLFVSSDILKCRSLK